MSNWPRRAALRFPSAPARTCSIALAVTAALSAGIGRAQEDVATVPGSRSELTLPSPGDVENAARAHSTAGEVLRVDVPRGVIALRTPGGDVRFRAKPNAIAHARVGERFTADYAIYGQQAWLVEERNPGVGLDRFGKPKSARGWVGGFDRERGTITLDQTGGQRTFSLHPAETEELTQGMEVDVLFVSVDGVDWAISVQRHG
jgi:hypothetical protein